MSTGNAQEMPLSVHKLVCIGCPTHVSRRQRPEWWLTSQLSVGQTAPWGASPAPNGEAAFAPADTPYLAATTPWHVRRDAGA